MLRSDRRTFLGLLSSLAGSLASKRRESQQPVIEVRPTALFQQPEGRKNLVRITVSGLSAPSRRAGRHGGTVAVRAGRDAERRSVGAALGAVGFSDRRRSRARPRGSAATAADTRETLDALLASVDPHRRRLHRSAGARARGPSQKP